MLGAGWGDGNHGARHAVHDSPFRWLDLDPALVHARTDTANDASGLREQQTRFDAEEEQFHQRVREAFLVLARIHPQRIKVLDASLPPELLHEQIIALVEPLLAEM